MSREPARPLLRRAAAHFAGTLALLSLFPIRPALHLDTARDLLLARDCVLAGHCGAGPRSSFGGWTQGALWSHLLELRELAGLGLAALAHAATLSVALAAALLPLVARALERPATALTWALWLPATLVTIGWPTLWNPTLWPLVLVVFYLALLHAARTRGLAAFVAAAAALALAVDVHVASAALVPFTLAVAVARAARPLVTVCLSAAVALAVLALDSPAALADNRELLASHLPALVCTVLVSVAAGALLRRRPLTATTVALAACAHLLLAFPLLAFVTGHPLHARYLAPLVTPAALLLGARRPGRLAAALACAGYLAVWLDDRLHNQRLRLDEVEPIAAALYARGLGFGDLFLHLRGPHAYDLLATLAALEPPNHRTAADGRDNLVFRTPHDNVPDPPPPGWTVIDLGGSYDAVIVAYRPWLRPDRLTVCMSDACTALTLDPAAFAQRPGMRWADRAHAPLPGLPRPLRGPLVYRIPVRPLADAPAPRVRLFADECKGWRIAGGSTELALAPDGPAELEFGVDAGPRCRGWLPPYVEVSDPALARLLADVTAPAKF